MSIYYRGATHRAWCHTKTRGPWRCQDCGEDVFYFTCDCGCKVFFEGSGYPWTQHEC